MTLHQNLYFYLCFYQDLIYRELQINSEGAFELFVSNNIYDYQNAGYFDVIQKEYDFGESIVFGLDRFVNSFRIC